MKYTVKFYQGDYPARQRAANADKAICYIEHHFNAGPPDANYTMTVVGTNASRTSKAWAGTYAELCSAEFGLKKANGDGVVIGGYGGRGNGNLIHTAMPAILVEPMFASNPAAAKIIRSDDGQNRLANVLAESIRQIFPGGGRVAFSVGHKYKTSNPRDRGVEVYGGGTEAQFAEIVLIKAKNLLEA